MVPKLLVIILMTLFTISCQPPEDNNIPHNNGITQLTVDDSTDSENNKELLNNLEKEMESLQDSSTDKK